MGIDGLTLRCLSTELHTMLVGGKVFKITQSSKESIQLHLYQNREKYILLCSTAGDSARVNISVKQEENLPIPSNFCMLLRKHITNATIDKIEQIEFERIIAITFLCKTEFNISKKILYCEIMGKYSNLILVENTKILGTLKSIPLQENSKRPLFCGTTYTLPPKQNKYSIHAINRLFTQFTDIAFSTFSDFLFDNIAGISKQNSRLLANILSTKFAIFDKNSVTSFLQDGQNVQALLETLQYYFLQAPPTPAILWDKECTKEFYPFSPTPLDENIQLFSTIRECIEVFYQNATYNKKLNQKHEKIKNYCRTQIKKEEKKLHILCEQQNNCHDMTQNKIFGELITANIYKIKRGDAYCIVCNYYTESNQECTIPLDRQLSPAANAQKYYKKYHKQQRTLEKVIPLIEKANAEIAYWQSILDTLIFSESTEDYIAIENELQMNQKNHAVRLANKKDKAKKDTQYKNNYRKFMIENFYISVGRNNLQNDRLLKDCHENDIWLHAQKLTSAHVIIHTNRQTLPDKVLQIAAEICAYFSSGKENNKVAIDYCIRKYVKKPNKAKAGFVTYTNFKTIVARPNRHIALEIEI